MHQTIAAVEAKYRKKQVVDVQSGDTVRVYQKIKEGDKERIQIFEGFVIRTDRKKSLTSRIAVRRIASGVGVEKSFLLHSPLITKVEVVKRSKVRRKYLSFMRQRSGKAARLAGIDFDKEAVNTLDEIIDKEVGEADELTKEGPKAEEAEAAEDAKQEPEADEKTAESKEATKEVPAEEAKEKPEEKPEKQTKEDKAAAKKAKAEQFRKQQGK